jgi:3-isopropylmalate/(R)-2-methylmalate dehydratase small subunit
MESLTVVAGIAVPMLRINIDTDQITPAKELIRMRTEGGAASLFAAMRYSGDREPNPDFILNREPWKRAQILLADRNFGCGSAREGAAQALRAFGFRVLIAPSFGGIFYNNCFRNGVLPVEMPIEQVRILAAQVEAAHGHATVKVDLAGQTVTGPDGATIAFKTPAMLREMLLLGADEIELTLRRADTTQAYRTRDRAKRPWAYTTVQPNETTS